MSELDPDFEPGFTQSQYDSDDSDCVEMSEEEFKKYQARHSKQISQRSTSPSDSGRVPVPASAISTSHESSDADVMPEEPLSPASLSSNLSSDEEQGDQEDDEMGNQSVAESAAASHADNESRPMSTTSDQWHMAHDDADEMELVEEEEAGDREEDDDDDSYTSADQPASSPSAAAAVNEKHAAAAAAEDSTKMRNNNERIEMVIDDDDQEKPVIVKSSQASSSYTGSTPIDLTATDEDYTSASASFPESAASAASRTGRSVEKTSRGTDWAERIVHQSFGSAAEKESPARSSIISSSTVPLPSNNNPAQLSFQLLSAPRTSSSSSSSAVPSSLFSKLNRPLAPAAVKSVTAPADDTDFAAMFSAASSTPATDAILNESSLETKHITSHKPVLPNGVAASSSIPKRSSDAFLRPARSGLDMSIGQQIPHRSLAAVSTSSEPPKSDFYAAALSEAVHPDSKAKLDALLHTSPTKMKQNTLEGYLSPSKRAPTVTDGNNAADTSSTSAVTHSKHFVKQSVAGAHKRKAGEAPSVSPAGSRPGSPGSVSSEDQPLKLPRHSEASAAASSKTKAVKPTKLEYTSGHSFQSTASLKNHTTSLSHNYASSSSSSKTSFRSDVAKQLRKESKRVTTNRIPLLSEVAAATPKPSSTSSSLAPNGVAPRQIKMKGAPNATSLSSALASASTTSNATRTIQRKDAHLLQAAETQQKLRDEKLRKQEEENKREREKRNRLYPSIAQFHTSILRWNVHEIDTTVVEHLKTKMEVIPPSFKDFHHYQSVMYPLLLEECRASVAQSLEEMASQQAGEPSHTMNQANAQDKESNREVFAPPIAATFSQLEEMPKKGMHSIKVYMDLVASSAAMGRDHRNNKEAVHADNDNIVEFQHDDLVIVWPRTAANDSNEELEDGEVGFSWKDSPHAVLAILSEVKEEKQKAENQKQSAGNNAGSNTDTNTGSKFCPPYRLQFYFDQTSRSDEIRRSLISSCNTALHIGAAPKWLLCKVQNMRTVHREYEALAGCDTLHLGKALLAGVPKITKTPSNAGSSAISATLLPEVILSGTKEVTVNQMIQQMPLHITRGFNEAQTKSIAAALIRSEGFTLIQGPPGTGKTTTTVGLVNMLFLQFQAKKFMHGQASIYKPPPAPVTSNGVTLNHPRPLNRQASAGTLQRSASTGQAGSQFRLLICAPSNAAIDTICDRLEDAIKDFEDKPVRLNIVRLGAGNRKNQAPPGDKNKDVDSSAPFHQRISLDYMWKEQKAARDAKEAPPSRESSTLNTDTTDSSKVNAASAFFPGSSSASTAAAASVSGSVSAGTMDAILKKVQSSRDQVKSAQQVVARERATCEACQFKFTALKKEYQGMREYNDKVRSGEDVKPWPGGDFDAKFQQARVQLDDAFMAYRTQREKLKSVERRFLDVKLSTRPERDQFQAELLRSANIICTTLSGAGLEFFKELELDFSSVIIDESAQSSEIQTLIPLKYNVKRCILVGDPNQLSATVRSNVAAGFNYKQSLFERIQLNNPACVELLNLQYRMHWEIVKWPSEEFYQGKLKTAVELCQEITESKHISMVPQQTSSSSSISKVDTSKRFAPTIDLRVAPYVFYDVAHGKEQKHANSSSHYNESEVNVAVQLFNYLRQQWMKVSDDRRNRLGDFLKQVGIISPYTNQVFKLRRAFNQYVTQMQPNQQKLWMNLEINSVDAFQGSEKAFIIFSVVRTGHHLGFLTELSRLNVALTRAQQCLFILGKAESLRRNEVWKRLVVDAEKRERILAVPRDSAALFSTAVGREAQYIRTMEPCPYTPAQMKEAEERKLHPVAAVAPASSPVAAPAAGAPAAASTPKSTLAATGPRPLAAPKSLPGPKPLTTVTTSVSASATSPSAAASSTSTASTTSSSSTILPTRGPIPLGHKPLGAAVSTAKTAIGTSHASPSLTHVSLPHDGILNLDKGNPLQKRHVSSSALFQQKDRMDTSETPRLSAAEALKQISGSKVSVNAKTTTAGGIKVIPLAGPTPLAGSTRKPVPANPLSNSFGSAVSTGPRPLGPLISSASSAGPKPLPRPTTTAFPPSSLTKSTPTSVQPRPLSAAKSSSVASTVSSSSTSSLPRSSISKKRKFASDKGEGECSSDDESNTSHRRSPAKRPASSSSHYSSSSSVNTPTHRP